MSVVTYFTVYGLKKFWCHLPEDGQIIAPNHVNDYTHKLKNSAFVGVT